MSQKDLVEEEELKRLTSVLRTINPSAEIRETFRAQVSVFPPSPGVEAGILPWWRSG